MKWWFLYIFAASITVDVAEAAIVPADFARGYSLELDGKGAIYTVELPEELYRTVIRSDLGDVRIFNGKGEIVPHSITAIRQDTVEERRQVPFFPLNEHKEYGDGDLAVQVKRNSDGAILEVRTGGGRHGDTRLSGYLLDVSAFVAAVTELSFSWDEITTGAVVHLSIAGSNDLDHWQVRVPQATLVDLKYNGQRVRQNTVALPGIREKYLRLQWLGADTGMHLHSVGGLAEKADKKGVLHWLPYISGSQVETHERGEILYDLAYHIAPSALRLRFPEENALAQLEISSRTSDGQKWHARCRKTFFHLRVEDLLLEDMECTFPATNDRQWRIEVVEDGAGLGPDRKPAVSFAYLPHELSFIARGEPPFIMAFGSGSVGAGKQGGTTDILKLADSKEQVDFLVRRAKLGRQLVLGGDAALAPPPAPLPWRSWILWLVLVAGVGALAIMVRSLLKAMRETSAK
jgi:hypothetical protein